MSPLLPLGLLLSVATPDFVRLPSLGVCERGAAPGLPWPHARDMVAHPRVPRARLGCTHGTSKFLVAACRRPPTIPIELSYVTMRCKGNEEICRRQSEIKT
jgi:hypothetical protein